MNLMRSQSGIKLLHRLAANGHADRWFVITSYRAEITMIYDFDDVDAAIEQYESCL